MNSLLEISNLTCGYDSIKILNDINLNVKEGQIVSLLGVNGAGKTTLINSIFGLSKIFNGEIRFNNEIINGCATHEVVQKGIGCIPEGRKVFPNMTVGDNLRVGSYLVKEKKEAKERFKKVFKLFPKLKERVSQIASGMSGGEQAMLSIGRGLMLKPTILIIDEPSLGLSPKLIQDTFNIIKEINNSGVTILLVEQNVEQTIKISDYCYLLSNNKIIVQGSGEDLSKNSEMQKAYFGEKKMNVEELTKELLKFNTINPPGDEEECIRYIGKLYEKNDFEVNYHKLSDKRYSLVVRKGHSNTKKPLCLTGHIDTVPLGSQVWTKDPFNGETDSGKLYGRGSSDMKAGIASIIDASLSVPIKEKSPGLEIVITAGEEIGCEGAFDLVKKSGALKKAGAVVVAEPTSNYPFVGHKGALWLKIKVNGITAHGSMPEKGINAIYKISEIIEKIKTYTFNCKTHSLMGNPSLNLGTINGGLNINSVPDNAEITLDIRSVPTSVHEEIISSLKKLLGNEVEFETLLDVESVCSEPSNVWIQKTLDIVRPYLGFRPDVKTATYFTDASALKIAYDNPPIIILGPGESAMAHKTDEYCLIDKIPESSSILKDIINNWNNG